MAEEPEDQLEAGRKLAAHLYADPDFGPIMRDYIAKKFPATKNQMPDVIAREQGRSLLTAVKSELEQDRKERENDRRQRALDAARAEIRNDPALSIADDEIPAIEKLMQDELIGTHKAAARLYRAQQQVAAPRPSVESQMLQVPGRLGAGGDEFKGILEDPHGWAKSRTHEMIADFRSGRGSRWGV